MSNSPVLLRVLVLLLGPVALWSGIAGAQPPTTAGPFEKGSDHVVGVPIEGDRMPGDTVEDPLVIPGLPFQTTGNTCGFAHDYDEGCPYFGSLSPDVVYLWQEPDGSHVAIDLCASLYDTKVFVYDFAAGYGIGNPIACNDDAGCGYTDYQSRIEMYFQPGHAYHIVVDGYGSDCGEYVLEIHPIIHEVLTCPAGALLEDEPDCHDGYVDVFNGGCNSDPPVFSVLQGVFGGPAFSVCGRSGNYTFAGQSYRDTDWYEVSPEEENTITFRCEAEFPVTIYILDGNLGCGGMQILDFEHASPFPDYAELTHTFAPGTFWFWVGPSVWDQVPCGSLYVMTITGYTGPVPSPAEGMTWGAVKERFR